MLDPARIGFRRLEMADLPQLHRWLKTGFVAEWYNDGGEGGPSFEEVTGEYVPQIRGDEPTASFVILYGDTPIGYIQTYRIRDYPDYERSIGIEEDAAGLDLFIGDERYIHRGLGSHILRAFLREIVFGASDVASCIIDPSARNAAAIRAYEKAGFRYLKTVNPPDVPEPEWLMRIGREDVLEGDHERDRV